MKGLEVSLALSVLLLPYLAASKRPDPADFTVYAFSQSDVEGEDPQVYEVEPDITIRAIGKWSNNGSEPEDYNFSQIARYHDHGILFMGSGTASVIFPHDFASTDVFDAMSTRDAENKPVPHDEFGFAIPARRGNMFNPAYREYLLAWAKIQVDGGVDGVNFDEVNAGFSGGQKYGFNGNEGFDDFAIADFNRYLMDKYPNFTDADWTSKFKITADNMIARDVPANDLEENFNYRTYLKAGGWSTDPLNSANPLAAEWGRVTANRMYADDNSFTVSYLRRYWKGMVEELRKYAAATAGREILISSNGLLPYVDYNSVGMYPWNPDEQTADYRGAAYVPVVDGHLNGTKSLQKNYRYLKEQNKRIAGDVPVAVFIDWPNDMMTDYLKLPLQEKKDYWQIFGAEAYANGLYPAFHLKDTVGSPTAKDVGILDFFVGYTKFYKKNRALFRENDPVEAEIRVSADNVSATLLVQRETGARSIHLVNHNYNGGIQAQSNVTVEAALPSCPKSAKIISPDMDGELPAEVQCREGQFAVVVGRLEYYDIVVL